MNSKFFRNDSIQSNSAKISLTASPFLLSSTPYCSLKSQNNLLSSNEFPSSHVKLRIPRSNSLSNSLNVPGNIIVPNKTIPNRNSMLEYRYMQNSNHLDMLNDFLDNLPSSEFDAMYPDGMHSNIMSMSVPDSRHFDSLTVLSNIKHETKNYDYDNWPKECNYTTKRITFPTSYVGTSKQVLSSVVPKVKSIDPYVSKNRNSGHFASNYFDPSREYDSEPNWSNRSIEKKDILSRSRNYHDEMTRKWVERGRNNSYRTSLSLDIVKHSSWNEFDDDPIFPVKKISRNRGRQRDDVVQTKGKEHSKNLTSEGVNKNVETLKKESNKELKIDQERTDTNTDITKDKTEKTKEQNENDTKKPSQSKSSESGSDDVFESPNRKRNPRFTKRRSSSLDALTLTTNAPFQSNQLANRNRNRSSVSINDKPEYHEYPKSPLLSDSRNPSGSIANSASTFHNSLGINPLHATPKRASIKKTTSNETATHSSDYDVRDRGRGRNSNGGRDSYRDRHRERDPDRGLSDREQRDSYNRTSFNRSMSNTEGTPEDKIGETILFVKMRCVEYNKKKTFFPERRKFKRYGSNGSKFTRIGNVTTTT